MKTSLEGVFSPKILRWRIIRLEGSVPRGALEILLNLDARSRCLQMTETVPGKSLLSPHEKP